MFYSIKLSPKVPGLVHDIGKKILRQHSQETNTAIFTDLDKFNSELAKLVRETLD